MSRHKTDPVERAFDAFIALTDQQRAEYDSMLRGCHRAKQNGTQEPRPRRRVKAKSGDTSMGVPS